MRLLRGLPPSPDTMERRPLGQTGLEISALGFGAASLGNIYETIDPAEGRATVHAAIDAGINYFDTAPLYGFGMSEERLGEALEGRRNEVILATKCCRDTFEDFDFSAERVAASCEESLKRLRTDHIDVFQIHDVEFGTREQVWNEAIPAAQKLKEQGKVRFVGITGLPVRYLRLLAEQAEIDTLLSWAHCNLLEDELQSVLVPLATERGFGLMSASPLIQGLLTDNPPPPWHRSPRDVIEAMPTLAKLCREQGTDLASVAIRYAVEQPGPATTIVGMATRAELQANLAALTRDVPDLLLRQLHELAAPLKNRLWFEGNPANDIPAK